MKRLMILALDIIARCATTVACWWIACRAAVEIAKVIARAIK